MKLLSTLIAARIVLATIVVMGDAGFDKAGRYGLDFGTVLALGGLFALAWLVGVFLAIRGKAWPALGLQLVLPCAACLGLVAMESAHAPTMPQFFAKDHQHLVGQSRADVDESIGQPPGSTLVTINRDDGEWHELRLQGMTISFSKYGIVTEVVPNDR